MAIPVNDKAVLRELGKQIFQIGSLPVQKEKAELWRKLNGLERTRPLVWINEVCWDEMNVNDELTIRCTDPFCAHIEQGLRRTLYQWDHMRADMIIDPWLSSGPAVNNTGFGVKNETVGTYDGKHAADFVPVITEEKDVDLIKDPKVTVDWEETERIHRTMREIFEGVIPVRKSGVGHTWFAAWDVLVQWTGITELYTDMMDRPKFVHKCIARMVDAFMSLLNQYEKLGLLSVTNGNHRVGSGGLGITDQLPAKDFDGKHVRPKDQWGTATGQIFSEVSPDMHEEFCLQYERKWLSRFGLNCYGCCEPLHNKMHLMRTIPNIRRVSMSPWVNLDAASERTGKDMVFSAKPSPAVVAMDHWDPKIARDALRNICDKTRNNVVELIFKDITTVRREPQRLWEWADIAMQVAQES